jgi:hypothetical protein
VWIGRRRPVLVDGEGVRRGGGLERASESEVGLVDDLDSLEPECVTLPLVADDSNESDVGQSIEALPPQFTRELFAGSAGGR